KARASGKARRGDLSVLRPLRGAVPSVERGRAEQAAAPAHHRGGTASARGRRAQEGHHPGGCPLRWPVAERRPRTREGLPRQHREEQRRRSPLRKPRYVGQPAGSLLSKSTMYFEHFRLSGEPFSLTPDPAFLFLSAKHREAMAAVQYGLLNGRGFITLIGEVGTGKTTILYSVLSQLGPEVAAAYVPYAAHTFDDLLD